MKIKICGNTKLSTVNVLNECLPDFVGFIFAEKSKRKISFETAKSFKSLLNNQIKTVGVFLNQKIDKIEKLLKEQILDIVQLHGDEDNEYISELKNRCSNVTVIKAFHTDENLFYNVKNTKADYILLDSFDKEGLGGTGKVFDWSLIPEKCKNKLFLAGGLNIDNIENALKTVSPYCLDINSGVETNGQKDAEKIRKIIQKIKGFKYE